MMEITIDLTSISTETISFEEMQYYLLVTKICKMLRSKPITGRLKDTILRVITLSSKLTVNREEASQIAIAYSDDAEDFCVTFAEYVFKSSTLEELKCQLEILLEGVQVNIIVHKQLPYDDIYRILPRQCVNVVLK